MPYTAEEDRWLNHSLGGAHKALEAIPMGPDLLKEYFMYQNNVPVSKTFFNRFINVLQERFR